MFVVARDLVLEELEGHESGRERLPESQPSLYAERAGSALWLISKEEERSALSI